MRILGRILLNPIFIAVVLALIFSAGGYQLPGPLEDGVNWLADMVMGLSFLLLGMQLGSRGRFAAGPVFSGALMKTVGIPAAVLTPALLFFDFAPSEVGALLTVFAAPTSVLSLIMTKSMNSNGNLAGELSAATLVLSLITMVLGTLVLGWLGYV